MNKNIYLTGFMGSGKSKIARILSKKLNTNFIDTDDVIEAKYKKTITQMFEEFGEDKFRQIESDIISDLIQNSTISVFALGGGSLLGNKNLDLVKKSGMLIYIQSGLDAIWERTKNKTKRPLLLIDGEFPTKAIFLEKAKVLMEKRLPGYSTAQIVIKRDGNEADEVAEEILKKLKEVENKY
jgi:shikimate kinase